MTDTKENNKDSETLNNNKYSSIKIQLNTGNLISVQFFFYMKDKNSNISLDLKHNTPPVQTNLQELGSLIHNTILDRQLLPVYYASVLFTKTKISGTKRDSEIPGEQWIFL